MPGFYFSTHYVSMFGLIYFSSGFFGGLSTSLIVHHNLFPLKRLGIISTVMTGVSFGIFYYFGNQML